MFYEIVVNVAVAGEGLRRKATGNDPAIVISVVTLQARSNSVIFFTLCYARAGLAPICWDRLLSVLGA